MSGCHAKLLALCGCVVALCNGVYDVGVLLSYLAVCIVRLSCQLSCVDVGSKRGYLVGAEHFFKKYYRELEKDNPCCPLCHREFDTEQEVRELLLEVRELL